MNVPVNPTMAAMAEYYGAATLRAITLGQTCDIKELAIAAFRAAECARKL